MHIIIIILDYQNIFPLFYHLASQILTSVGSGPIFLDQLNCVGSEESLVDCPLLERSVGLHHCNHSMDVGLRCSGMYVCMYVCMYVNRLSLL